MGQRTEILRIAATEIGYREGANNSNKYGDWYGMNHQPWCAIFISWCADKAGALGANHASGIIPRTAWVPDYAAYYARLKQYQAAGAYQPQPGDLVIFGVNSHAGLVESCDGLNLVSIEGNASASGNNSNGDGVYRRLRKLNDSWIRGYCTPAYQGKERAMEIKEVLIRHAERGLIAVKAVNIGGENYVRLRDMEKLAAISVDWDGRTPGIAGNYK